VRVRRGGGRIIRGATENEGDGEREKERNRLLTPGSRGRQTREEYRPQEKEEGEKETEVFACHRLISLSLLHFAESE